jgi:hypothetical protein
VTMLLVESSVRLIAGANPAGNAPPPVLFTRPDPRRQART